MSLGKVNIYLFTNNNTRSIVINFHLITNIFLSEDAFEDAAEPEEKDKIPEAAGAFMIMMTITQIHRLYCT